MCFKLRFFDGSRPRSASTNFANPSASQRICYFIRIRLVVSFHFRVTFASYNANFTACRVTREVPFIPADVDLGGNLGREVPFIPRRRCQGESPGGDLERDVPGESLGGTGRADISLGCDFKEKQVKS